MAGARVQGNTGVGAFAAGGSIAFPGNTTAGNLLIACLSMATSTVTATIADSQGNTWTLAGGAPFDASGPIRMYLWYLENCPGGANTITFTSSAAFAKQMHCHEISGLVSSGDLDQVATGTATNVTSVTSSATGTTSQAGEYLLAFCATSQDKALTAGTNYTSRATTVRTMSEDRNVTSTGTYTASFSWAGNTNGGVILVTLKEATGGTDVTATPGQVTATLSLSAPAVSATRNPTVTPAQVALVSSLTAPTVSAIQHVTVAPSQVALTSSVQAPTVSTIQNPTITPGQVAATLSLSAPTVSTTQNVTVSTAQQTATLSMLAPTVSTGVNVTVTPGQVALTASLSAPTVSAEQNATATPGQLTAMLSLSSPTVTTGGAVTVSPAQVTLAVSLLAAAISTTRSVTVTPAQLVLAISVLTATASTGAPTITPTRASASDAVYSAAAAADASYGHAVTSTALVGAAFGSDQEG